MSATNGTTPTSEANTSLGARVGYYRWVICALIFFATTINYVDRQVFSILAPTLEKEIHWNEQQYGYIVAVFQWAYAAGLLLAGWVIDKIGTRSGYAWSIVVWSVAAISHALASTPLGFGMARGFLGLGEGGNFPTAIKTIAEWFPRKERALATGIFNGGTNIGAILVPLFVPWLTLTYGWRAAFIVTGAIGFLWLFFWLPLYRPPEVHPRLSKVELAYIR
ncbi:MAG TPA: MFS transporter, partial [Acidobacteriota bacterium]|nr:MFS transporter [Acidobacteriota bacterium]